MRVALTGVMIVVLCCCLAVYIFPNTNVPRLETFALITHIVSWAYAVLFMTPLLFTLIKSLHKIEQEMPQKPLLQKLIHTTSNPIHAIFNPGVLTEQGKVERSKFLGYLAWFVFFVLLVVATAKISGAHGA